TERRELKRLVSQMSISSRSRGCVFVKRWRIVSGFDNTQHLGLSGPEENDINKKNKWYWP
ncbi:unnamed protein product, partial [Arabidopsis halleri]